MKVCLKKPEKGQLEKKNVFLGGCTLYFFICKGNKIGIRSLRSASDVDDLYDVSFVDDLYFNYSFDKTRIKNYISWFRTNKGEHKVIDIVEKLKSIGFEYATKAGISLGIDDLKIPPKKNLMMRQGEADVYFARNQTETKALTDAERYQQIIDLWHRTSEILKQNVVEHFRSTDLLNPIFMMAFSGARGNISQVRQLVGMRGLMSDPEGNVIDYPIRSNFKEGLSLTEYLISCYGARKGVVDTALKTANAGYLTRRLVDVSQHVFVDIMDCNTSCGIVVENNNQGIARKVSLKNRLIGRVLAEDIDPIAFRNQQVSKDLGSQIGSLRQKVLIRSPLTCQANKNEQLKNKFTVKNQKNSPPISLKPETDLMERSFERKSMCQLCYGWGFTQLSLVRIGEAIGIIAGQSIGEPGTQLTMRTFHTGGVFSGEIVNEIRSGHEGIVDFSEVLQGKLVRTFYGRIGFLTKVGGFLSIQKDEREVFKHFPELDNNENTKNTNNKLENKSKGDGVGFVLQHRALDPRVANNGGKAVTVSSFEILPSTIVFVRQGERILENQLIAENLLKYNQVDQRAQEEYLVRPLFDGEVFSPHSNYNYKIGKRYRSSFRLGFFWVLAGKVAPFNQQQDLFCLSSVRREDENIPASQSLSSLNKKNEKDFNGQVFYPKAGDLIDKKSLLNLTVSPISGLTGFVYNWDGFVSRPPTVFNQNADPSFTKVLFDVGKKKPIVSDMQTKNLPPLPQDQRYKQKKNSLKVGRALQEGFSPPPSPPNREDSFLLPRKHFTPKTLYPYTPIPLYPYNPIPLYPYTPQRETGRVFYYVFKDQEHRGTGVLGYSGAGAQGYKETAMVTAGFFAQKPKNLVSQQLRKIEGKGFTLENKNKSSYKTYEKNYKNLLQTRSNYNKLVVNRPILKNFFKNIQFSNIGYFWAENTRKKNINKALKAQTSLFTNKNDQFFVYNLFFSFGKTLKNHLFLKWFPEKYKTLIGGFIKIDKYYYNTTMKRGQIFWVPESCYQLGVLTSKKLGRISFLPEIVRRKGKKNLKGLRRLGTKKEIKGRESRYVKKKKNPSNAHTPYLKGVQRGYPERVLPRFSLRGTKTLPRFPLKGTKTLPRASKGYKGFTPIPLYPEGVCLFRGLSFIMSSKIVFSGDYLFRGLSFPGYWGTGVLLYGVGLVQRDLLVGRKHLYAKDFLFFLKEKQVKKKQEGYKSNLPSVSSGGKKIRGSNLAGISSISSGFFLKKKNPKRAKKHKKGRYKQKPNYAFFSFFSKFIKAVRQAEKKEKILRMDKNLSIRTKETYKKKLTKPFSKKRAKSLPPFTGNKKGKERANKSLLSLLKKSEKTTKSLKQTTRSLIENKGFQKSFITLSEIYKDFPVFYKTNPQGEMSGEFSRNDGYCLVFQKGKNIFDGFKNQQKRISSGYELSEPEETQPLKKEKACLFVPTSKGYEVGCLKPKPEKPFIVSGRANYPFFAFNSYRNRKTRGLYFPTAHHSQALNGCFSRTPLGDLCDLKTYTTSYVSLPNQYKSYKNNKNLQTSKSEPPKRYCLWKGFYNSFSYLTREKEISAIQDFDKTSDFYNHYKLFYSSYLLKSGKKEKLAILRVSFRKGTGCYTSQPPINPNTKDSLKVFKTFGLLSKYLLKNLKNQKTRSTYSTNQKNCQILYKEGWFYLPTSKKLKNHQSFLPAANKNQSLVDNLCFDHLPVCLEYIINKKKDLKRYAKVFKNFYNTISQNKTFYKSLLSSLGSYPLPHNPEKTTPLFPRRVFSLSSRAPLLGFQGKSFPRLPLSSAPRFPLKSSAPRFPLKGGKRLGYKSFYPFLENLSLLSLLRRGTKGFVGEKNKKNKEQYLNLKLGFCSGKQPNVPISRPIPLLQLWRRSELYSKAVERKDAQGKGHSSVCAQAKGYCLRSKQASGFWECNLYKEKPFARQDFLFLLGAIYSKPSNLQHVYTKKTKTFNRYKNCLLDGFISIFVFVNNNSFSTQHPFSHKNKDTESSHPSCSFPLKPRVKGKKTNNKRRKTKKGSQASLKKTCLQKRNNFCLLIRKVSQYSLLPETDYKKRLYKKNPTDFNKKISKKPMRSSKSLNKGFKDYLNTKWEVLKEKEPKNIQKIELSRPFARPQRPNFESSCEGGDARSLHPFLTKVFLFVKSDLHNCNQRFNKQKGTNKGFYLERYHPKTGNPIRPNDRIETLKSDVALPKTEVSYLSSLLRLIIDWLILEIGYINDLQIHQHIRFSNTRKRTQGFLTNKPFTPKKTPKRYTRATNKTIFSKNQQVWSHKIFCFRQIQLSTLKISFQCLEKKVEDKSLLPQSYYLFFCKSCEETTPKRNMESLLSVDVLFNPLSQSCLLLTNKIQLSFVSLQNAAKIHFLVDTLYPEKALPRKDPTPYPYTPIPLYPYTPIPLYPYTPTPLYPSKGNGEGLLLPFQGLCFPGIVLSGDCVFRGLCFPGYYLFKEKTPFPFAWYKGTRLPEDLQPIRFTRPSQSFHFCFTRDINLDLPSSLSNTKGDLFRNLKNENQIKSFLFKISKLGTGFVGQEKGKEGEFSNLPSTPSGGKISNLPRIFSQGNNLSFPYQEGEGWFKSLKKSLLFLSPLNNDNGLFASHDLSFICKKRLDSSYLSLKPQLPGALTRRITLIITDKQFWCSYSRDNPRTLTLFFSPYNGEVLDTERLSVMRKQPYSLPSFSVSQKNRENQPLAQSKDQQQRSLPLKKGKISNLPRVSSGGKKISYQKKKKPYNRHLPFSKDFSLKNKNVLLLTRNERFQLEIPIDKPAMALGQIFNPGENLTENLFLPFSGQIIEIEKNKVTVRRAQNVTTSSRGALNVRNGDLVDKDYALLTLFYQKLTTDDIIQGIPKIEQLFEARRTKEGLPFDGNLPDYLDELFVLQMKKHKYNRKRAAQKSFAEIQRILIDRVQDVYISQGVIIPDKHLEIVVRQMTEKVVIVDDGGYDQTFPTGKPWFLPGEFVDLDVADGASSIDLQLLEPPYPWNKGRPIMENNYSVSSEQDSHTGFNSIPDKVDKFITIEPLNTLREEFCLMKPLTYKPILLGVTTVSLECESFFSAASFQETTRILSGSAIKGQKDFLHGLKERVILGDYVNVGTGSLNLDQIIHPFFATIKPLLNIRHLIEAEKARQTHILLAIFAEREIIVDVFFQTLPPIPYLEETLLLSLPEVENTFKQPFQKELSNPPPPYLEKVEEPEEGFSGDLFHQLFQEKGKEGNEVDKTGGFGRLLQKKEPKTINGTFKNIKKDYSKLYSTEDFLRKDTREIVCLSFLFNNINNFKLATSFESFESFESFKSFKSFESFRKDVFWDPFWEFDLQKVKESLAAPQKKVRGKHVVPHDLSLVPPVPLFQQYIENKVKHLFSQQLSPLFLESSEEDFSLRLLILTTLKDSKWLTPTTILKKEEPPRRIERPGKKKKQQQKQKKKVDQQPKGIRRPLKSLSVTQPQPLPELARYGMGFFTKKVEEEERAERERQQAESERQIDIFKNLSESQKDYIKNLFPDDYPIPSKNWTKNKLTRRSLLDWDLCFDPRKSDNNLLSIYNDRGLIVRKQRFVPDYYYPKLLGRDTKKNGKTFTGKKEVEEKVQQFLRQVENKFYGEYSLDFFKSKTKTINKLLWFFNNTQAGPSRKPTQKENLFVLWLLPIAQAEKTLLGVGTKNSHEKPTGKEKVEKTKISMWRRIEHVFYAVHKYKVEHTIINKLLFTYNNTSLDFIETKKNCLKQLGLKPYREEKEEKRYAGAILGTQEKVEKTLNLKKHDICLKKHEIYLRLFPYNNNQFAQTIAYIYQQLGLIPYLSSELKNDELYTLPDNFEVDSITGKVYIKNNDIYLKYLIDYFSETKSSLMRSVICFCFVERYEKRVKTVSDYLFFFFWFYIILKITKVMFKRKLEKDGMKQGSTYKYKKNEVHDELKILLYSYKRFIVKVTFG